MIIVRAFLADFESLADLRCLPSVAELRPPCCPGCENPAHSPSGCLGIVGHGTYQRQVLGLGTKLPVIIFIRRYFCLACKRTISVVPDWLIPWRWYCGAAILAVLVGMLLLGTPVARLCATTGPGPFTRHWTTPARWAGQLGARLWHWHAPELNLTPTVARAEALGRLLGLGGAHARSPDGKLESAARRLVGGTTHFAPVDALSAGRTR